MQKIKVNSLGIASLDLPFVAPAIPQAVTMPGWDSAGRDRDDLVELIRRNPEAAARILQDYGLDDSFLDSVYYKGR